MGEYPALDLTYSRDRDPSELQELLYACLDEFEPLAIHEHDALDGLRVFFRLPERRDRAVGALADRFGDRLASLAPVDVADDDWARRSQARLSAVRVGRIVVAPPWAASEQTRDAAADQRYPGDEDILIVIEPSMGFGTGHHASTRLCLRLLQHQRLNGARAIDVGTGSGVLAIASWKLGADRAVAIDCDPDALQNARDNIDRNGARDRIDAVEADLSAVAAEPGDVVMANLTSSVLQRYADSLAALVRPGGCLIVSGFGPDDLPAIEHAFRRAADEAVSEEAWCAALFRNLPRPA